MKRILIAILTAFSIMAFLAIVPASASEKNPKREFRGAWLHVIGQSQWQDKSTEQAKAYIRDQFDRLVETGCNAVIFQVRPTADAVYKSDLEPWSAWLTGKRGKAPAPMWDPMEYAIDEAHKRGLEFHAWLNPYRVTGSAKQVPPKGHLYYKEPKRFVKYGGQIYFDPGLPENRKFINDVVLDIVNRYDVDGIHFDDYFYPYPKEGEAFPDKASFAKYGNGMKIGDWRRKNVDLLIEEIHDNIAATKPWVIFGVSPFGIWRNKKSDPRGSETNGLQNYDALYADVLLWAEKGWVDYLLPQLYWELEHKAASYLTLVEWWNNNAGPRHMYIGQDVSKTMKLPDLAPSTQKSQLDHKIRLTREAENISGNCWWPGYAVTKNFNGVADSLSTNHQSTIALVPTYPWISDKAPAAVKNLKIKGNQLSWSADAAANKVSDAVKFVVYRFDSDKIDLDDASAIVAVTRNRNMTVDRDGYYVVTALDRVNNESAPSETVRK